MLIYGYLINSDSTGFFTLGSHWGAIGDVCFIMQIMEGNGIVVGGKLPQHMAFCLTAFVLKPSY